MGARVQGWGPACYGSLDHASAFAEDQGRVAAIDLCHGRILLCREFRSDSLHASSRLPEPTFTFKVDIVGEQQKAALVGVCTQTTNVPWGVWDLAILRIAILAPSSWSDSSSHSTLSERMCGRVPRRSPASRSCNDDEHHRQRGLQRALGGAAPHARNGSPPLHFQIHAPRRGGGGAPAEPKDSKGPERTSIIEADRPGTPGFGPAVRPLTRSLARSLRISSPFEARWRAPLACVCGRGTSGPRHARAGRFGGSEPWPWRSSRVEGRREGSGRGGGGRFAGFGRWIVRCRRRANNESGLAMSETSWLEVGGATGVGTDGLTGGRREAVGRSFSARSWEVCIRVSPTCVRPRGSCKGITLPDSLRRERGPSESMLRLAFRY